jgi:hypothetical protein
MHEYILGWTPAIIFLIWSYFFRCRLSALQLRIEADSAEYGGGFKSIEEKLDAIHAEMRLNLCLHGLKSHENTATEG